jgi:hypothetical protein
VGSVFAHNFAPPFPHGLLIANFLSFSICWHSPIVFFSNSKRTEWRYEDKHVCLYEIDKKGENVGEIYEKKIKLSQTDINKSHINMRRNFLFSLSPFLVFRFDSRYHLDAINFPSITIFRRVKKKNWKNPKKWTWKEKEASQCPMSSLSRILWLQKYREHGNKSLNMFVYKIYCSFFLIEISLKIVLRAKSLFYVEFIVAWKSLMNFPFLYHIYDLEYLFAILIFFCWLKWIFQLTKHSLIVYYACDIKKRLVCMAKSISSSS